VIGLKTSFVQCQLRPVKPFVKKDEQARPDWGISRHCEGLQPRGNPERKRWIASLWLAMTGPPEPLRSPSSIPASQGGFSAEQLCVKHNQQYYLTEPLKKY